MSTLTQHEIVERWAIMRLRDIYRTLGLEHCDHSNDRYIPAQAELGVEAYNCTECGARIELR